MRFAFFFVRMSFDAGCELIPSRWEPGRAESSRFAPKLWGASEIRGTLLGSVRESYYIGGSILESLILANSHLGHGATTCRQGLAVALNPQP